MAGVSITNERFGVRLTKNGETFAYGVETKVDVWAGPFSGSYPCILEYLQNFLDQLISLHATLNGQAFLDNPHSALHIAMEGNGRGSINVSVDCFAGFAPINRLTFEFVLDQSYLPPIIQGLAQEFQLVQC